MRLLSVTLVVETSVPSWQSARARGQALSTVCVYYDDRKMIYGVLCSIARADEQRSVLRAEHASSGVGGAEA